MDPVTIAAIIGAGASLVGGLMSAHAQKEEKKKQRLWDAKMQGFQNDMNAAQNLATGQQNAFGQMMEGYGKALT